MAHAPERSTLGVEVTIRDTDGELVNVGSISGFLLEVHGSKPGMTNPIAALTKTTLPTSNPMTYVLDITGLDRDAVGDRLYVEYKVTYNSTTLGSDAVSRSEAPLVVHLKNSRISS